MSIVIYGSSLSPYVRKVTAFAAEKGMEVELKPAVGASADPDFATCSPFKKMPAMRDGDFTLCDSTAIITYLDALKLEPNLIPLDPKQRAKTIWYEEFSDTILFECGRKMFFNRVVAPRFRNLAGDHDLADRAEREELPPILDYLEGILPASGFLVGDRFTLADIAVASPFANLAHMEVDIGAAQRPKLAAYVENILARPSFASQIARERKFLAA